VLTAPPWPDGWVVEEGLYAAVAGDPADRGALRLAARHVEEAVPRIADDLGIPTGQRLRVYLCHTTEQFQELQPARPEAWADATTWPGAGLVFLRAPRLRAGTAAPLSQVLDHEVTHALIGQRFHGDPVPRWLHEGLAQVVAREYSGETTRALARGTLGTGLLSLDELVRGFPEDPDRARLAYAQSADLVAFIRNRYGQDALRTLVRRLAAGRPVRAAFREATGEGLDEVDEAWRGRLRQSQLWVPALVDDAFWWLAGGLLLVGGWLRLRRRNRERRAWLEREEALRRDLEAAWLRHAADPATPGAAACGGVMCQPDMASSRPDSALSCSLIPDT
jgi:hypothetical protein